MNNFLYRFTLQSMNCGLSQMRIQELSTESNLLLCICSQWNLLYGIYGTEGFLRDSATYYEFRKNAISIAFEEITFTTDTHLESNLCTLQLRTDVLPQEYEKRNILMYDIFRKSIVHCLFMS